METIPFSVKIIVGRTDVIKYSSASPFVLFCIVFATNKLKKKQNK